MKIVNGNIRLIVVFSIILLFIIVVNIFFGKHPILDFFQFLINKDYFWLVPLFIALTFGFWQRELNVKKKIGKERREIYTATMRTIQDLLQNSASSMQLLILDMKDTGVHDDIIQRAEKNIDELKSVITTLASIDPMSIQLKELNDKLSIIKMNE